MSDWFYMNPKEVPIRTIYELINTDSSYPVELWEDAGVLEIELSAKESMDFELLKPYFKDDFGSLFLKEHNIQTLYMVSFSESQYETAKKLMQIILHQLDGFFCGDSEDFTPVIRLQK